MTDIWEHWDAPREPPMAGDEATMLIGSLERQRLTLAYKCGDLDADGMRVRIGASDLTLGGLLKHMALVEDHHWRSKFLGQGLSEPWSEVDFDSDPNWEFRTAADDSPEELFALWTAAVERSRVILADALAQGDLDTPANFSWPNGNTPTLRRLLVDLVEEYARHVGHADLIRESIDGRVGEDAPWPDEED
jgi:uncharacterized damage-inducible protein DinB